MYFAKPLRSSADRAAEHFGVPRPSQYSVELHGAGYAGKRLTESAAGDALYIDSSSFYKIIDVAIVEVSRDRALRSSGRGIRALPLGSYARSCRSRSLQSRPVGRHQAVRTAADIPKTRESLVDQVLNRSPATVSESLSVILPARTHGQDCPCVRLSHIS